MPFVIAEDLLPPSLADADLTDLPLLNLIEDLPPFARSSYDIQGVIRAIEGEYGRLEQARQELIASWFPSTADRLLGIYEILFGLPVEPAQLTLGDRRAVVLAYLRRLKSEGTGLTWEGAITELVGPNWTYEEHDPADPGSPAVYTIHIELPFHGPIDPPGSLVPTIDTDTGTLDPDEYFYAVTAVTGFGETLPCTAVSATVTTLGEHVDLTWTRKPDGDPTIGYRIYRGTASADLYLIGENEGILSNTFVDYGAEATGQRAPTQNTSASLLASVSWDLVREITPAHIAITTGYTSGWLVNISQIGLELL